MSESDGELELAQEILFTPEQIQARVEELAAQIRADYGDEEVICIGVLKGAVFFLADLLKHLPGSIIVDFLQTSSYGASTVPGEVRIRKDLEVSVHKKNVLVVEDIVDTGHTLQTLLALMKFRGAASVKLCALLDKASKREVDVQIDYCGFEIDDVFVVGYGLDFGERYRNLPYIGHLVPK